jgi:NADPH:quinone reductase-like Zn-dependent oxidoreductase
VVTSKGVYTLTEDFPYPSFAHENEVIIRSRAVGLNPIDWQSVEYQFCVPEYPWITGREMAGVVEAVGSEVEGLKIGDRVWTSEFLLDVVPFLIE